MKFKLAVLFTVLSLAFFGFVFYSGIFMPHTLNYVHMLVLSTLVSFASYYISMGAFADIDEERAKH